MKNLHIILLSLFIVTFFALSPAHAKKVKDFLELEIVYPEKHANINAHSTFFVGNTTPGARLRINNQRVKVYPNGGFVHVVDLNPGTNVINLQSKLGDSVKRNIYTLYTPEYEKTIPPYPLAIDKESVTPSESIIYKEEDLIQVSFKGSTGHKAYFSIGKKRKNIPMIEQPPKYIKTEPAYGKSSRSSHRPVRGIYKGTYSIKSKDIFNNERLVIKLVSNKKSISYKAPITISTISPDNPPIIAAITTDYATVRTSPGKSRLTPLPEGTLINLTGKKGDNYRFKMGGALDGWIATEDASILPKGTPVSESSIDLIDIVSNKDSIYFKIPLSQKLPFVIDQLSANEISLKLFGVKANIDLFSYENKDEFLKEVKWVQEAKDAVKINIKANSRQFWGYKYYYENNDTLVLELRKPPKLDPDKLFENTIICIDAGHGGEEEGAKGPLSINEKTINLDIALKLAKILEEKGVNVVMTRSIDEEVDLYQRVKHANYNDSLILLSIHNNSLPDGRNPYNEHGTSTYYYHSQSLPLAKILHKALLEDLKFDDLGLFWSSFALTRPHEPLSVLLELGFMINPEEYNQLIEPEFQDKIAASIARGLEYFLFVNSDRQILKITGQNKNN